MSLLTGMVSATDIYALTSTLAEGLNTLPQELELASLSEAKALTLTNGTSTLLAVGTAIAEGRTKLVIKNNSDVRIILLKKNATNVKVGLPVEPHQLMVLKFPADNTTEIYGRSTGYSADITVWEV